MLEIEVPAGELYGDIDPVTGKKMFIHVDATKLCLEHSLVSVSKWEMKWHKAFLSKEEKTDEETIDYIRCMTLSQNVNPNVYKCLTSENISTITKYINDPHTATTVHEHPSATKNNETPTAELIYYWMISYNIPVDICQKWHLNRLLTLIRVFNVKNAPPKKRSTQELLSRNAALNKARRQRLHSKG